MPRAPDSGGCRLAVSMGDPRGVGPEVCALALSGDRMPPGAGVTVVGDRGVLEAAAEVCGVELHAETLEAGDPMPASGTAVHDLDNFPQGELEPRRPDARSGRASLEYIETAAELVRSGRADALVTGPINKEAIAAAGSGYPGHTEMLADMCGAERPVMLMVSGDLRVGMATTHVALRAVPDELSIDGLLQVGGLLAGGVEHYFAGPEPVIAVCGLNPHCGDGGRFGDEEARVIEPAVETLNQQGIDARGPLPADTVFERAACGEYDAVLAMYHDQGMIPVKFRGLDSVVNVTLGLDFIRTSVGHGTAYDIAGTGRVSEGSLLEAMRVAVEMAAGARSGSGGVS